MSADARSFTEAPIVQSSDVCVAPRILSTAFTVGFFFSFRAAMAMITARWLRLGTEPGVFASMTIQGFMLIAIMFQAIGPAARPLRWIARQSTVRRVLGFLAFSCLSLLWSATISRPASFLYWCAMASDVAIVVLLLRGGSVIEVSHSLMRGYILSTCVIACIAWITPASYDFRLGDPDYLNTNQIGNLCAMAIFMAQFLAARKDGKWKLTIFFLTVTLLRSLSKATIIAFMVAEGLLLVRDRSMSRKTKTAIVLASVLLIAAYWGLIGSYVDVYTTTGNQAETLTGRTGIWAYTLEASLDKPWFGNGIDAMWKVFPPFGRDMFEARHAENELLQQFFAYGVAGVVLLVGLYGSLYRRVLALPKNPSKGILIAIMLFIFVRGLAEAEPFDLLLPLWMITLISCIAQQASRENIKSSSAQASALSHTFLIPGSKTP